MNENKVVISLQKINVSFYKSESDNFTLKKSILSGKFIPQKQEIFNRFSLEVKENTILGIEGSNGIGKTTLLSVIAGIIPISSGKRIVNGKVLPLLGLGHIFHNDLDIYRNIELWNLSFKTDFTINEKFVEEIIISSGLKIQPKTLVRSLSSGMKSRLAFELAMRGQEEILLLDEIFSVGDKNFREKSRLKMKEKLKTIKCAIIISHDYDVLNENCNKIIRITNGSSFEQVK